MIPKTIHYCWFGRNPKSELIEKCIASWRKFCLDWEIVEWNEDNWDIDSYQYTREAYDAGKWAFVSDVARLDVLCKLGGGYISTRMLKYSAKILLIGIWTMMLLCVLKMREE